MYVIVEIAGQQFKVEKDQNIFVHRLPVEEGEQVEFDKVLFSEDNGEFKVGAPIIKGASVTAKVLSNLKADKIKVFKKKRRKGYQKLNGHRQYLSEIQIENIALKPAAKKEAEKAEKKDLEKDIKKEVKKDLAKDTKKVEKKEVKKEAKKDTLKVEKKEVKKDTKKAEKKEVKTEVKKDIKKEVKKVEKKDSKESDK